MRFYCTDELKNKLDRIPQAHFRSLNEALGGLENNPRPPGVKKPYDKVHRIRVGDYRIIYSIFDHEKVVFVSKIERRTERTYRGV